MDAVFDTAGGGILERSWGVLKPGGRMIIVATNSEGITPPVTTMLSSDVEDVLARPLC